MSCVERELFWDEVSSFCVLDKECEKKIYHDMWQWGNMEISRYVGRFILPIFSKGFAV